MRLREQQRISPPAG